MRRLVVALVVVVALAGCGDASQLGGGDASQPASTATHGTVVAAPRCPVERPVPACGALRVVGAEVVATQGSSRVADARSGRGGAFSLALPAGTYLLTATLAEGLRTSARLVVHVPQQGLAGVTITLDSGIR
jgi:hypothetical protein